MLSLCRWLILLLVYCAGLPDTVCSLDPVDFCPQGGQVVLRPLQYYALANAPLVAFNPSHYIDNLLLINTRLPPVIGRLQTELDGMSEAETVLRTRLGDTYVHMNRKWMGDGLIVPMLVNSSSSDNNCRVDKNGGPLEFTHQNLVYIRTYMKEKGYDSMLISVFFVNNAIVDHRGHVLMKFALNSRTYTTLSEHPGYLLYTPNDDDSVCEYTIPEDGEIYRLLCVVKTNVNFYSMNAVNKQDTTALLTRLLRRARKTLTTTQNIYTMISTLPKATKSTATKIFGSIPLVSRLLAYLDRYSHNYAFKFLTRKDMEGFRSLDRILTTAEKILSYSGNRIVVPSFSNIDENGTSVSGLLTLTGKLGDTLEGRLHTRQLNQRLDTTRATLYRILPAAVNAKYEIADKYLLKVGTDVSTYATKPWLRSCFKDMDMNICYRPQSTGNTGCGNYLVGNLPTTTKCPLVRARHGVRVFKPTCPVYDRQQLLVVHPTRVITTSCYHEQYQESTTTTADWIEGNHFVDRNCNISTPDMEIRGEDYEENDVQHELPSWYDRIVATYNRAKDATVAYGMWIFGVLGIAGFLLVALIVSLIVFYCCRCCCPLPWCRKKRPDPELSEDQHVHFEVKYNEGQDDSDGLSMRKKARKFASSINVAAYRPNLRNPFHKRSHQTTDLDSAYRPDLPTAPNIDICEVYCAERQDIGDVFATGRD